MIRLRCCPEISGQLNLNMFVFFREISSCICKYAIDIGNIGGTKKKSVSLYHKSDNKPTFRSVNLGRFPTKVNPVGISNAL